MPGVSYAEGRGVAKDESKAVQWYEAAAAQGLAQAQLNLCMCIAFVTSSRSASSPITDCDVLMAGGCYAQGRGVVKDDFKAVQWCEAAAARGHAQAQFNLGMCVGFVTRSRSACDGSSPVTEC
jgi:TPR repeat protein